MVRGDLAVRRRACAPGLGRCGPVALSPSPTVRTTCYARRRWLEQRTTQETAG
jgi:hypothetical protein